MAMYNGYQQHNNTQLPGQSSYNQSNAETELQKLRSENQRLQGALTSLRGEYSLLSNQNTALFTQAWNAEDNPMRGEIVKLQQKLQDYQQETQRDRNAHKQQLQIIHRQLESLEQAQQRVQPSRDDQPNFNDDDTGYSPAEPDGAGSPDSSSNDDNDQPQQERWKGRHPPTAEPEFDPSINKFCCPTPNCTARYSRRTHLHKHQKKYHPEDTPIALRRWSRRADPTQMIHFGTATRNANPLWNNEIGKWVCPEEGCGQAFGRPQHLKRHRASRHEGPPKQVWRCEVDGCDKEFHRQDYWAKHVRNNHPSGGGEQQRSLLRELEAAAAEADAEDQQE